MRGDSSSGQRSKGGEETVGDLGARIELIGIILLLGRLPVERPHPHTQPREDHQVLEESLDGGIKLMRCCWLSTSDWLGKKGSNSF